MFWARMFHGILNCGVGLSVAMKKYQMAFRSVQGNSLQQEQLYLRLIPSRQRGFFTIKATVLNIPFILFCGETNQHWNREVS